GYEPDELPDCSIPRLWGGFYSLALRSQAISQGNPFLFNLLACQLSAGLSNGGHSRPIIE
ncbi:hypothetical protein, partial [Pseudomonas shirazensis]